MRSLLNLSPTNDALRTELALAAVQLSFLVGMYLLEADWAFKVGLDSYIDWLVVLCAKGLLVLTCWISGVIFLGKR